MPGIEMRVVVQGLWHLGSVISACLASVGHHVTGLDEDADTVAKLNQGNAPLLEPGLDDLLTAGIRRGLLDFTTDAAASLEGAEVLWVAYDTPVDDDDRADADYVMSRVVANLPLLAQGAVVIVSSQLPVGSMAAMESAAGEIGRDDIRFACSPENLRLGGALKVFLKPDRVVVGVRDAATKEQLMPLLTLITDKIEWMGVESAEMTKHAINSFLATSVTFANEIASICEMVGADAKEVERGLKTEMRIGPKAYLSPGGPFAGGTLARDILFLEGISKASALSTPLLSSVKESNDQHKGWVRRKIRGLLGDLHGASIAVWGLTYKVGTSTLRRSQSVELCDWLISQGVSLHVHDPAVVSLPENWHGKVQRYDVARDAASKASILIIGTEWPEYRQEMDALPSNSLEGLTLIDANRFLTDQAAKRGLNYIAVGSKQK
jgi:UDPglucose 6-dehydrogenase